MLYLAYDTETTGLPLNQACSDPYDTLNWPRIYQIAAILFDDEGFEYGSMNRLIRPNGWVIPKVDDFLKSMGEEGFHEKLGITTEYLMDSGIPLHKAIDEFVGLADQCDAKVCHNASFGSPVMLCEFFRVKHFPFKWNDKVQHCTKLITEPILKIPGYHPGTYKWPTLQEAYKHFFGKEFDGAHDALADVRATMDVFLEVEYLL